MSTLWSESLQPHLDIRVFVAEIRNARGDQPAPEPERRGHRIVPRGWPDSAETAASASVIASSTCLAPE